MVKTVLLTRGRAHDCTQAEALLADLGKDETVIGEKAYVTDAILDLIETAGASAVIPSKSNWKSPRSLDRETYKTCNLVERFSDESKSSAGSPRVMTRPPATSYPPCVWQSVVSCSGGSRTNQLSPLPREFRLSGMRFGSSVAAFVSAAIPSTA